MRLNGDSHRITGALYKVPCPTRLLAQTFADELCRRAVVKPWKIQYTGKHHSNLWAKAYPSTRTISVHKKGENFGTLVHEIAHECSLWEHGEQFKIRQEYLTDHANEIIYQLKEAGK